MICVRACCQSYWTFLFLHHKVDVCYCWRATVLVQHLYYCHTFQNIVFMKFEMFKHWKDTNNEMMEYWFSEETFCLLKLSTLVFVQEKKKKEKKKHALSCAQFILEISRLQNFPRTLLVLLQRALWQTTLLRMKYGYIQLELEWNSFHFHSKRAKRIPLGQECKMLTVLH